MALPDVTLNILDGGLGIVPPSSARTQLKVGLAPKGAINTVQSVGDLATLLSLFGKGGDLVEASALALQQGGPLLVVSANPSTYGTAGTVSKTAVGTGSTATLGVTAIAFAALKVKVAVGGTLGVATVQFSTDGGATWSAAVATAATVMCPPAPFVTFAFGAGTYVAGDTWTVSAADGTVTFSGSGFNGCTVSTVSPVDNYSVVVNCTTGGALGSAQVTYSLDGGNTVVGPVLVPASGKYSPSDTGLLFTFTNALVAGDAWSCAVTGPAFTTTDLSNAMNAALADARTWGFVHVVGPASTVAGAASVLASLDSALATAATQYRFARGLIEVPVDTDANTLSGFAAASSTRVGACAGYAYVTSPVNGRQWYASSAWAISARANKIPVSEDFGKVLTGSLTATSLKPANTALAAGRDETATPGLDAGRFSTLRTIVGLSGAYVTAGRSMANPGSDYSLLQNGRVMDVACSTVRGVLLSFLNASVRVDPTTGYINERDAQGIEAQCRAALNAALVQPGDASSASVVVTRNNNILSTQTLQVSIRVVPLGYARTISVDIGFQNPATLTSR